MQRKIDFVELILARHCASEWANQGLWQGQIDVPLSKQGKQSSAKLALRLAKTPPTLVYSSPLERCLSTAEAIARVVSCDVEIDPRLKEIQQGTWEGLSTKQISLRWPDAYHKWLSQPWDMRPPEGESLQEVTKRVFSALDEIVGRHPNERIGVVTHLVPSALIRIRYCDYPKGDIWKVGLALGDFEVLSVDSKRGTRHDKTSEVRFNG